MFSRFRQRSYELELIDTGDYSPEEYEGCLVELRRVNRWLGDNRAITRSLLTEVGRQKLDTLTVLDVGAGSGELLRVIARWARNRRIKTSLTGLELNERSAASILQESTDFPEIQSVRGDALALPFPDNSFDYAISSLFTHHLKDDAVITVLREMNRVARRGIFVIDLNRHPIAYLFYTTAGKVFLHNRLIRADGALSILRSFKPAEMRRLADDTGLHHVTVTRRFPYRLVLAAHK
jgi:ubiquinone/menaquinone biosynthesis C-methylase UbiE